MTDLLSKARGAQARCLIALNYHRTIRADRLLGAVGAEVSDLHELHRAGLASIVDRASGRLYIDPERLVECNGGRFHVRLTREGGRLVRQPDWAALTRIASLGGCALYPKTEITDWAVLESLVDRGLVNLTDRESGSPMSPALAKAVESSTLVIWLTVKGQARVPHWLDK